MEELFEALPRLATEAFYDVTDDLLIELNQKVDVGCHSWKILYKKNRGEEAFANYLDLKFTEWDKQTSDRTNNPQGDGTVYYKSALEKYIHYTERSLKGRLKNPVKYYDGIRTIISFTIEFPRAKDFDNEEEYKARLQMTTNFVDGIEELCHECSKRLIYIIEFNNKWTCNLILKRALTFHRIFNDEIKISLFFVSLILDKEKTL